MNLSVMEESVNNGRIGQYLRNKKKIEKSDNNERISQCKNLSIMQCLFDLILYVPSTIFQLNRDRSSWVEPVLSWDKCVLLTDHNAVKPMRLEPTAPRSPVKHSTTEPLRSPNNAIIIESIK